VRLRAALALAAVVGLAPAPPAAAARLPNVRELVARNEIAAGASLRPANERETWSVRLDGLAGNLVVTRRDADVRSDLALGPFTERWGATRDAGWRQDANGRTTAEPVPPPVPAGIDGVVGRVRRPLDAYTVTTRFGDGHENRVFYDARSFLIVRVERLESGRLVWTDYDDFRTGRSGRTRPWHYVGGDDASGPTYEYRLVRDETRLAIAPADVAPPVDRPFVDFPAGRDVARLPTRIVDGRVFVRLTIAGRALDFLVDTGSSSLALASDVARDLGLMAYGRTTLTAAGTVATRRVIVRTVEAGPLVMHDVVMRTIAPGERPGDVKIAGLLGFDFLSAVGLRIDYDGGTVDAYRPGTLAPPSDAYALDVRILGAVPLVAARVDDSPSDSFILDSGAAFSVVLFQRFTRTHPGALPRPVDGDVQVGDGVGGAMAYRTLRESDLALGPLDFPQIASVEAIAPRAFGLVGIDGLVGSEVLRRFTVFADYASAKVWLVPGLRTSVRQAD